MNIQSQRNIILELKSGGREDLVHLVTKIPTELGVGYDISSRELDDTIRNIEVKTTISSRPIVFNKIHLTPNEWQAARQLMQIVTNLIFQMHHC